MRPPPSVRHGLRPALVRLLALAALPAAALLLLDDALARLSSTSAAGADCCTDNMMALVEESKLWEEGADGGVALRNFVDGLAPEVSAAMPPSYDGRHSPFLFSQSYAVPSYFSFELSTQENYGEEGKEFYGPFKEIRANLDFDYHGNYKGARQAFQDRIIEKLLERIEVTDSKTGSICKTPTEPWIVFTAGVMGAGKGHVMKQLSSRGLFPRKSFIVVDPDEIRSHFTEYHIYAKLSPKEAGNLTHREAGYIAEIVAGAALRRGYNVLVDGSLRDHEWYREYFGSLRRKYPVLRIAILHVTAPREAVFERAARRAAETGRVVPAETLEDSLRRVPVSVKKLAPMADFFAELDNSSGEATMATEGMAWDAFRDNWAQTCPWVPGQGMMGEV